VVLRTSERPELLAAAVEREVNTLDPALAVADIRTMDQLVARHSGAPLSDAAVIGIFRRRAGLVLVGLYALLAYSVRQRTAELGIRLALGAQKRDSLRLIMAGAQASLSQAQRWDLRVPGCSRRCCPVCYLK